ncbi:MAG: cytochrome c [Gammaproteobacteria bacterium]
MRRRALPTLLACIALNVPFVAWSATAPADAIKYRKAVMSAMGAHIGAFMLINFGKVEHQDHLKAHTSALADLGAEVKVLFPAGTDTGDTDALPLIWKEQDQFKKLVTDLETSSAKLRDAAAANDKAGTMAAFKAVGEACKGCHDRYRKADD